MKRHAPQNPPDLDPITILIREHRRISEVLAALERYSQQVHDGGEHDQLGAFVRFCSVYMHDLHHRKEEDILFVAMVEAGLFPADILPVIDVLDEHQHGEELLAELAALAGRPALSAADRAAVRALTRTYVTALRHHILVEDRLFVRVAAMLEPRAMDHVAAQFEDFAREHAEQARDLTALAEVLVRCGRDDAAPRAANGGR